MADRTTYSGLIGAVATLLAVLAPAALAQTYPTGPAVPTSNKQCQDLNDQYRTLIRRLLDQTLSCSALRGATLGSHVPVPACRYGAIAHRECTALKASFCTASEAASAAVNQCYDRVRAYQEHQRRVEREQQADRERLIARRRAQEAERTRQAEHERQRFLLERAQGVGTRVGAEAGRTGVSHALARRNVKLGRFERTLALLSRYAGRFSGSGADGVQADPYVRLLTGGMAGTDVAHGMGAVHRLSRALTKISLSETVRIHKEAMAELTDGLTRFDQAVAEFNRTRSAYAATRASQDSLFRSALGPDPAVGGGLMAALEVLRQAAEAAKARRQEDYDRAVAAVAEARRQAAAEAERQRQATLEAERQRQAALEAERLAAQRRWQEEQHRQQAREQEELWEDEDDWSYRRGPTEADIRRQVETGVRRALEQDMDYQRALRQQRLVPDYCPWGTGHCTTR